MRKFLALLLAVLMASPLHAAGLLKNVAGQKIGCQLMTLADGTPFTGAVTVSVTGDAGTLATGSVGSGACTHEGKGYHTYAPAQAETNYSLIAFTFEGTGARTETIQVFTDPGVLATDASVSEVIALIGTPTDTDIATDIANGIVTAADIRTAVGLATANLDTQLTAIDDYVDAEVGAIKTKTDFLPSATAGASGGLFIAGSNAATTVNFTGNLSGSVGSVTGLTNATIADAIWDEALAGHATAGSAGAGLSAAQSAGDPWSTAIPGAYSAGTAGFIVGTNLDAAVSTAGGGGATQPRINRKPDPAFTVKVSRRADGTHKAPTPIRITPGAIDAVYVFIDMSPLFGNDNYVATVGTPTVEAGGSITASAEGPRDTYAVVELDGTATASEERTITVPVTMDTGTTVNVAFDVEVFAE